ncbi:MAG TPA: DUF5004 domain-containing protein, partial [Cyclobacteriaceae bacterium]
MKKLSILFIAFLGLACDDDTINETLLEETPIRVEGTWAIEKVYQNEVDITDRMNFSTFSITLDYNGELPSSYNITSDDQVPFITGNARGSWAFNNVVFPTRMHFINEDTLTSEFAEPLFPEDNTKIM